MKLAIPSFWAARQRVELALARLPAAHPASRWNVVMRL
jgi:hypothetical protein